LKFPDENIFENVLHLSFIKNDLLGLTPVPTGLRTMIFPMGANNEAFLNNLVSRCEFLRDLRLVNSTYKSLPRSIGKLKHLRYLNLANSKELKRLPNSVCKLQNLHILQFNGCKKLQTLPKIGNLISLRQLFITTKQFNFPDKEIAKLTSLERLWVDSCGNLETLLLEGIPLSNLEWLNISSCGNLKSMSPFHVFPNLEILGIKNCPKLKLSLGNDNQIPKLKLKLLTLNSLPQLVSFPNWLQGCADTLRILVIANCENFDELPEWLSALICLHKLELEDCPKLLSLPKDAHCLSNLEGLSIKGCPELCRSVRRE